MNSMKKKILLQYYFSHSPSGQQDVFKEKIHGRFLLELVVTSKAGEIITSDFMRSLVSPTFQKIVWHGTIGLVICFQTRAGRFFLWYQNTWISF